MDNDDDSSVSSTPNDFLLSTYKENPLSKMNENSKILFLYQCSLCQKCHENPLFTCSTCINTGQFYSSKSSRMKSKRHSYEEQSVLLKTLESEKKILQSEFQQKRDLSMEIYRISDEIQLRKNRFQCIRYSMETLRTEIDQKKKVNKKTQHHIDQTCARIRKVQQKLFDIKRIVRKSSVKTKDKTDEHTQTDINLQAMRRKRLHELITYLFHIQRVSADKDARYAIIENLREALGSDDRPDILEDRYQLVYSFLPRNGKYQVENLVSIYNSELSEVGDSPRSSPSCDSYETLGALSHACQLINIIAFYLHIKLPFHLHQLEFNKTELVIEDLRADIAKLNANIVSSCLAQGIHIESANVSYTLENLLKLLTCGQYGSRPEPIDYPENYIDMLEKEVINVSRALSTSYWFDNYVTTDEKDITEILNSDEYELVIHDQYDSNDIITTNEQSSSSTTLSTSGPQQSSVMSSSINSLISTGSAVLSWAFRSSNP